MSALSDTDTARAIYGAGIDILVDLKGYTQGARTGVMMLRPAPVQVNFLGYPGTLGGGICDYIITDGFVTPMTAASDYSESFAYMPHSYQPHGRRGVIGRKPARSEAGLPELGFVFCCFNQAYKFTPPVFDLWCRLLEAVPDSVLWLLSRRARRGQSAPRGAAPRHRRWTVLSSRPTWLKAIISAACNLPISSSIRSPMGRTRRRATRSLPGCLSWTRAGDIFPSRVAGGLLHAAGLPELIARSEEDYFAIALALATEPGRLEMLKAKLRRDHLTTPLFDVAAYTLALEDLYETMMSQRRIGADPVAIWASTK